MAPDLPLVIGNEAALTQCLAQMMQNAVKFSKPGQTARIEIRAEKIGTEWLIEQSRELKKFGVPVLHYYTLGKPKVIWNVVKELV